jgi:hypothetical protein
MASNTRAGHQAGQFVVSGSLDRRDRSRSTFGAGQIGNNVRLLNIDDDYSMSLVLQLRPNSGTDTAGAPGNNICTHWLNPVSVEKIRDQCSAEASRETVPLHSDVLTLSVDACGTIADAGRRDLDQYWSAELR